MSAYSPFGGSGFRTTNPRPKDRPCRHCRRLIDHHSPHVICGNCHANRMARRDEDDEPASLSSREGCRTCGGLLAAGGRRRDIDRYLGEQQ